jgi:hypothetical protein
MRSWCHGGRRRGHLDVVDNALLNPGRVTKVDWRGLLRANAEQGHQALKRLIDGRVRFTPQNDFYEFCGKGTIEPVLAGVVQNLASLTGFEPVLPP